MQPQQIRNPKSNLYLLLQAKKMSDSKNYDEKNKILRDLLTKYPDEFEIDSELNNKFVGITHTPTAFKIHVPRHIIPPLTKRQEPTMKTANNLSWGDVPEQAILYANAVRETFNKVSNALTPGTYAWVNPYDNRVVVEKSGFVSTLLEKEAIAHDICQPEDSLTEGPPWIMVKCSRDMLLSDVFSVPAKAFMLTPSRVSNVLGGPTPLASTIAGGLLTAGLGYGAGALAEKLAPKVFERGALRKRLALLGGLAGAIPGLTMAGVGASTWRSPLNPDRNKSMWQTWIKPNVLFGHPKAVEPPPPLVGPPSPPEFPVIKAGAEALAAIQPDISPEMQKAADMFYGGASGPFALEPIPVDAFNRLVVADPFTPPNLQAATLGVVNAASNLRGGSRFISPMDIARVGLGMGAGYVQATIGGKVLGALAGITPEAQQKLQTAGVVAGAIKSVVPGLFGQ